MSGSGKLRISRFDEFLTRPDPKIRIWVCVSRPEGPDPHVRLWYRQNAPNWYGIELRTRHLNPGLHSKLFRYVFEFYVLVHKKTAE
jgi:hypothetical protein